MHWLTHIFALAQQTLFEGAVQPLMVMLGLSAILAEGFHATGWLLVGLLQIGVMLSVLRLLERRWPLQPVTDRAAVRTDIVYTLIHRLGVFRLALFFTLDPLWDSVQGELRLAGMPPWALDGLWPGVTDQALISFGLYLVVLDALDWLLHRAQHRYNWWWALHALHHSQRQLTLWSDNRNHLADDVLRDSLFALVAIVIGVAPAQFMALVAITQLLESLSHANTRLGFARWLQPWLVGPRFHRAHHAIGAGHEAAGPGTLGGCNFAVLFPLWDRLAGTARFDLGTQPTGIRDQLPEAGARDYGRGFWAQQWLGLKRLAGRA